MMASVIESNRDANWIKGLAEKGTFAALSACFPQQNQNCQKVCDLQKLQWPMIALGYILFIVKARK